MHDLYSIKRPVYIMSLLDFTAQTRCMLGMSPERVIIECTNTSICFCCAFQGFTNCLLLNMHCLTSDIDSNWPLLKTPCASSLT